MKAIEITDFEEPHFDFDHLRPITKKDLQQFDAAELSYIQAHHYAMDLVDNHLI